MRESRLWNRVAGEWCRILCGERDWGGSWVNLGRATNRDLSSNKLFNCYTIRRSHIFSFCTQIEITINKGRGDIIGSTNVFVSLWKSNHSFIHSLSHKCPYTNFIFLILLLVCDVIFMMKFWKIFYYCTIITRKSKENETERGNSVNECRVHKITLVGARISIGWL